MHISVTYTAWNLYRPERTKLEVFLTILCKINVTPCHSSTFSVFLRLQSFSLPQY
ncbi:hypothetical protein IFVP177_C2170227 [Vibrio parahaemolyticus]